jgi:hypothetical protein
VVPFHRSIESAILENDLLAHDGSRSDGRHPHSERAKSGGKRRRGRRALALRRSRRRRGGCRVDLHKGLGRHRPTKGLGSATALTMTALAASFVAVFAATADMLAVSAKVPPAIAADSF